MKRILVVVDAQNDFITGSLNNEEALKKVPNIVNKIEGENWDAIFATLDTHGENYLDTREGKNVALHCVKNTDGWRLNKSVSLALLTKENITEFVEKPTFGSYELVTKILELVENEPCYIELVGFCTDICVVSNAMLIKAALFESADICVDASCCAGVTPESHKAALNTMKMCQIDVINED